MRSSTFILKNLARENVLESLARRYPDCEISAQRCFLALLGVAGGIMDAIESQLARRRTSQGRIRVLLELQQAPGQALAAGELADRLMVTPATITGLLDGLERECRIRRQRRREDRRGVTVCLTKRGNKFLDEVMPERFRCNSRLMAKLSPGDRRALVRLLETVARGLDGFARI